MATVKMIDSRQKVLRDFDQDVRKKFGLGPYDLNAVAHVYEDEKIPHSYYIGDVIIFGYEDSLELAKEVADYIANEKDIDVIVTVQ
jgi:hypothetical protein